MFPGCLSDGDVQEESGQQPQHVASALINTSPKVPRVELPNTVPPAQPCRPERFDVTLQRKDNEGFGFVILTSKTKPPPGGENEPTTPPRTELEARKACPSFWLYFKIFLFFLNVITLKRIQVIQYLTLFKVEQQSSILTERPCVEASGCTQGDFIPRFTVALHHCSVNAVSLHRFSYTSQDWPHH